MPAAWRRFRRILRRAHVGDIRGAISGHLRHLAHLLQVAWLLVSPTIGAAGRGVHEAFASSPGGGGFVAGERPHLMRWVTVLARLADAAPGRNLRRVLDVLDPTQSGHRLGIGHRRDRAPEEGPGRAICRRNPTISSVVQMTRLTSGGEGQEMR